ncbi:hypothetical protein ACFL1R_09450, partial [Candidatus Latescibacterota bacterium]
MESLSSLAGIVTRNLWVVSWQITILVGIVWIIDRLSRRTSSLFRYWLWCIVLIRLCIPVNLTLPVDFEEFIRHRLGIGIPDIAAPMHELSDDIFTTIIQSAPGVPENYDSEISPVKDESLLT